MPRFPGDRTAGRPQRALLYEEPLPIRTTRRYFRPVTADATPAMRSERVCTIDSKIWGIDVIESKNVKVPSLHRARTSLLSKCGHILFPLGILIKQLNSICNDIYSHLPLKCHVLSANGMRTLDKHSSKGATITRRCHRNRQNTKHDAPFCPFSENNLPFPAVHRQIWRREAFMAISQLP